MRTVPTYFVDFYFLLGFILHLLRYIVTKKEMEYVSESDNEPEPEPEPAKKPAVAKVPYLCLPHST